MNVENKTFVFLVSWGLWIVLLSAFSKTRLGYVLLYYSLALMIIFVLATEYKQLAPFIGGIITTRDLQQSVSGTNVAGNSGPDPDGDGTLKH